VTVTSLLATAPSQSGLTGGLTGPTPPSIDGGFVDSSDDDDHEDTGLGVGVARAVPRPAAGSTAAAAAAPGPRVKMDECSGGRRRVLPASLGTTTQR
jgi:hypothetical protein